MFAFSAVLFYRSLYHSIRWNGRLIEISGSRGVGKTTLMLQKIHEINSLSAGKALYCSLDDPFFYKQSLTEVAYEVSRIGGTHLFLDKVHKYPSKYRDFDWSAEIKTLYDKFPEIHFIYTGSSILKLYKGQGDLSRRKLNYQLPGLSLREFLQFTQIISLKPLSLDEIIQDHASLSKDIIRQLRIIPEFRNYLKTGYFPYQSEAPEQYEQRLKNSISVILENDIPAVTDISFETTYKLKKLLSVIASSAPYTPNLSKTRNELFIADQRTLLRYLFWLEKAELITILSRYGKGNQLIRKPEKIYLNNTNLLNCIDSRHDIGTIRETFFLNQLSNSETVNYTETGDFMVNNKWLLIVGGRNKNPGSEIKNNFFLALDDIETSYRNVIPLWLFGFLY